MKRRSVGWCLLAAVGAAMAGCGWEEVRRMPIYDVDLSAVPAGEHEGSFSYGGFTYVVRTTVADGRIEAVRIVRNRDDRYGRLAGGVVERILARQTPNVDAVTGATTTSKALMKAVENSLTVR